MRKDRIYLHIGMHKTATTAIQAALSGFSDGTTRYARLLRPNHTVDLISLFSNRAEQHRHFRKHGQSVDRALTDRRRKLEKRLAAELDSPERVLVFSGEGLAYLEPDELAALRARLAAHADEIRCLAYLRDPVGFASSAFQQRIRGGHTRFDIPAPNYRKRFARFLEVFGAGNVDFAPFELTTFRNRCIVTDICDRIGIDADRVEKRQANESLSAETVALLFAWNADGLRGTGSPLRLAARKLLIQTLSQAFPGKFVLDHDIVQAAMDHDDCAWIEQVAGFPLRSPAAAENPDAVRGPEDLAARVEAIQPQLRALLDTHGLPKGEPETSAIEHVNTLYRAILRRIKRAET